MMRYGITSTLIASGILVAQLAMADTTYAAPPAPQHGDLLSPVPTWDQPVYTDVRREVLAWRDSQQLDGSARTQIGELWPLDDVDVAPSDLTWRLARTYAAVDPQTQQLIELGNAFRPEGTPPAIAMPDGAWLSGSSVPPLFANNIRLLCATWLARSGYYDECLATLAGLTPQDVVDPAALLFYRAVSHHRLVQSEACEQDLATLLERQRELPQRYQQLAQLMSMDIAGLEVDSLDHIARRMDDVGRRLDLGQADKKVRDIEDGVIESLDKLIKNLEDQQQQQQAAAAGGSAPQNPMPDSRIAGGNGPGKVDKKDIGDEAGWGNLPPKEREQALQQIGRDFPSHYRDVVEQYFKKLAGENAEKP